MTPGGRPPHGYLSVVVDPGYPGLGWREDVAAIERQRVELVKREREIIGQALAAGVTLSEVGRALGISRQSAWKRFGFLRAEVRAQPDAGTS